MDIADSSEFRGARFEEDETDQKVLRRINRKLTCDRCNCGDRLDSPEDRTASLPECEVL